MAGKRRQPEVDGKHRSCLAYFSTSRTESILIGSNPMPAESTDLDLETLAVRLLRRHSLECRLT